MRTVTVTGEALTLPELVAVARGEASAVLGDDVAARMAPSRAVVADAVEHDKVMYGITTGFGALVTEAVAPEFFRRLQANLLRSHAAGTGPDLPREVVRAALAIRLNGLLLAHSGIRPLVLQRIAELLEADLVPRVPRTGSLGASGDLAPSAHAFLPLLGEGEVTDAEGRALPGAEALRRLGREPLRLEMKEGLALINGTHFMAAIGALLIVRARRLLDVADLAAATAVDALRGATPAFDPRVHALRPVQGQLRSAANIAATLEGSRRTSGAGGARLQDAYSLRCAAQVHGAAREAHAFFARLVTTDLNAVTDNPLVFGDPEPQVISAGNFHGQSLALAFDTLRLALADLASISERRTFRLVSPSTNGDLPAFLTPDPGASSGYMIAQYTAAALVSELRALAHPVSVDSVPTSDNQEDHVSMGMTAAVMALEAIDRAERVLAIELLCGCQALDCDPGDPAPAVAAVHAAIRAHVPMLVEDRPPAPDIAAVHALLAADGLPTPRPADRLAA